MNLSHTLSAQRLRWLIAGLVILSTILFVAGIVIERGGETHTNAATHEESSEAESHTETETAEGAEGGASAEAEEASENILGVNPEEPWVVTTVALGWVLLLGIALRFGGWTLAALALVAAIAAIFDAREVIHQVGQSNGLVATLAAIVTAAHIAVSLLAFYTFRTWSRISSEHPSA
jgi:hypothetical protein